MRRSPTNFDSNSVKKQKNRSKCQWKNPRTRPSNEYSQRYLQSECLRRQNLNSKFGEEQKKKNVIKCVEVPISTQIRLKSKKIGQSVNGLSTWTRPSNKALRRQNLKFDVVTPYYSAESNYYCKSAFAAAR